MKRSKYQTGLNEEVEKVIVEAKRKRLPFITKIDIIKNLKQKNVKMRDPEHQVGQALYHLQKKTKYRRPKIKKFFDKHGRKLGWTTFDDRVFL